MTVSPAGLLELDRDPLAQPIPATPPAWIAGHGYALVFDVESVGLHGEAFAYGYVVLDLASASIVSARLAWFHPDYARGLREDRQWVTEHVPPLPPQIPWASVQSFPAGPQLRRDFWQHFTGLRRMGAVIAADCPWPVEANFLSACVADDPGDRQISGPYPLLDISSFIAAAGFDPLMHYPRLPMELPEHNPLCDALQSARLLREALVKLGHFEPKEVAVK